MQCVGGPLHGGVTSCPVLPHNPCCTKKKMSGWLCKTPQGGSDEVSQCLCILLTDPFIHEARKSTFEVMQFNLTQPWISFCTIS